jgi:hypothetical protein
MITVAVGAIVVVEIRLLSRIFGPKRDEIIGGWRKFHNEKLHNLYYLSDIIRVNKRMRMAGHIARMRRRVLVGNKKDRD